MAKRVLTAALIQKIRPPAKGKPQLDVFDKGYPGLFLRVPFGGTKAFVHAYRHGGRQYRRKLGLWPVMQLAEAREAWREIAPSSLPVETASPAVESDTASGRGRRVAEARSDRPQPGRGQAHSRSRTSCRGGDRRRSRTSAGAT